MQKFNWMRKVRSNLFYEVIYAETVGLSPSSKMRKGWLIQFLAYVAWIHVCYGKYEVCITVAWLCRIFRLTL